MAHGGVGEPSSEKLHPFFVKAAGNDLHSTPSLTTPSPRPDSGDEHRRKKRRKTDSSLARDEAEARKPCQKRRNGVVGGASVDGGIECHLLRPQHNPLPAESTIMAQPVGEFPTPPLSDTSVKQSVQPLGFGKAVEPSVSDHERLQTTPSNTKKVLKFNPKTGTLGSPPKRKEKKSPSLMVYIRYGRDERNRKDIGDKVTHILEGKLPIPETPTKNRAIRASAKPNDHSVEQSVAPKTTHPFFTSKGRPQPSEQSEPIEPAKKPPALKHSVFMSTPVSPRKQRNPFASTDTSKMSLFGIKSSGTKTPGAMYPMWPPAEMSHVRGEDLGGTNVERADSETIISRKSKGHVTTIRPKESILSRLVGRLDLNTVRGSLPKDEDTFTPAPAVLRLPQRRFESGLKLQQRIIPQLAASSVAVLTNADDSSQDELATAPQPKIHPTISRHYDSLATQLSAYDKSNCESLSWTQKHAPTTAAQVLQTGKEAVLLKQWLEAMKVQSVETGGDASGDRGKAKSDGAPKKRRKNKLDGFVVDSDDEASEMDELSDEDNEILAGVSLVKKSVIRSGDVAGRGPKDQGRLKNTIVISGPHGCGKTAAVYAVANELGFEIFEINSSSRRSGKDILEKVGDMTRNHLVQQHRAQLASAGGDEDDEVDRDIKSGKQGMMTSFFKPKSAAGRKRQTKKQPKEKADKAPKGSPPKSQKQSLVLLEEADVLYEEDKQFWATLIGMMVQSKRPFVVTCNDEDLIPIQSLNLHGIFRFSHPPASLAVDLCLLIAANEGHALGRAAVESLYRSRGDDLRATITELNYWCQMGVGDRRGGFDWFYLRWPKGSDLDENGDVVRVISENTYLQGMGWVGRDMMATTPDRLVVEEEVLHQVWDAWQLDMGDWYDSLNNIQAPASAVLQAASQPTERLKALVAYDEFCGAMSEADICSSGAFETMLREHIDPTLPALTTSVRDDFTIGRTLLEVDPVASSASPNAAISTSMKSLTREIWHNYAAGLEKLADTSALRAVDEGMAISILDASFRTHHHQLGRLDVARAFDAIAISPKTQPTSHLDPSVFDRTMRLIVLDVAPWVRGIVAFEHQLMQERLKLSNLLSEGGKKKRMRTTRSAISALEGGERRTTRRERYFGNCLSTGVVMRTGAESFQDAVPDKMQEGDPEDGVGSSSLSVESP
ncbi:Telomere length regulation protein elg1 [Tolypocladium capitatum]|uniref:Telomere length regulation protein elg1 n=1 Tax=Tolypocladium capitatum TaxID=45235 RepID=A0A2K3QFF0_9HYPO|nr:Telomere length regulation protein elg1 [Tolypocladium capitatum]